MLQLLKQIAITRLKALSNAVELVAPQTCGIDDAKPTKRKSGTNARQQHPPDPGVHRVTAKRAILRRLNSAPKAGPGVQP